MSKITLPLRIRRMDFLRLWSIKQPAVMEANSAPINKELTRASCWAHVRPKCQALVPVLRPQERTNILNENGPLVLPP